MKLLCSFIFLLSVSIKIDAQNILPKAYEITTDTIRDGINFPDSCWQILADTNSKWTIEQVSSPPVANGFLKPTTKTTAPDFGVLTHWERYILKNAMSKNVEICIPGNYDKDEIFTKDSLGQWHYQLSGFNQPWSKLDGFKTIRAMPLTIPAGKEILIYERLTSNYHLPFSSLSLFNAGLIFEKYLVNEDDGFISEYNSKAVFYSFMLGVLGFAALMNFVFFLMVREKIYLYFALFVASFGLMRYAVEGLLSRFLFSENPWIGYCMIYIIVAVLFFSLIQFARSYLNTKKYFPAWDKLLVILSIYTPSLAIAFISIGPLHYRLFSILSNVVDVSSSTSVVIVLITFFLYIRRPERVVRLVVIAGLPVLLVGLFWFADSLYSIVLTKMFGVTEPSIFKWHDRWSGQLELSCAAWFAVIFSWILLLRFIQLRKEVVQQSLEKERLAKEKEIEKRQLVALQKIELEKTVDERTAELKHSLENLRSTQAQLIQSEKMASLGELTAGIAHEIQNPLNFVNNFSEVNNELITELVDEADKGNTQEVKTIANDIKQNLEKINHHGKRADSIVKGMLQHSRNSSGQKELTDINALCDEYLRLAYHGLRAKDKSFNAKFETDFDNSIGKINIVPQEIGRVILNLINNAFYAVSEKAKLRAVSYEPCVSMKTKKVNDKVEVRVIDNGNGIPKNVVDKIFQPFFTTKPTGQGTGLGLSLAYDIIKAHGGEIRVETKEGEGSVFVIKLPIQV